MLPKVSWRITIIHWNLWITDTVGTGFLSFVKRLSLSLKLVRTHSQTTSCLVSLVPRLPSLGTGCTHSHVACSPDHDRATLYWSSSCIARVAPCSAGVGNTARQWWSCIYSYEWAIIGLFVLGGYFLYSCDHSGARQCPLYRVERLSASRRLAIPAKNQSVIFDLSVLQRLCVSRRVC